MKFAIAVFTLSIAYAVGHKPEFDDLWLYFKKIYGKSYSSCQEDYRRHIWEENIAKIALHNLEHDLGKYSYRLGLSNYSDLEHEEFVSIMNGLRQSNESTPLYTFTLQSNINLPNTVDWREEGLVTPVKNQGSCGSCWAFSATGSLEGQHKKKTGVLVSLSEQNLVDCSRNEGNFGCGGGGMDNAFNYIKINKGIDTEESYPYEGVNNNCRFKRETVGATCEGHIDVMHGNENALQEAVATVGPVSVAIDASSSKFSAYKEGIFDYPECSSNRLDHGVLVVGYGTEDGKVYWLVKNSWGESWGMKGYIKMSRNKNNQCGIATGASYPLV